MASFCEEISRGAYAARLNRLLSSNPETTLGSLKLLNDSFCTLNEETLNNLIKVHFPSFIAINEEGQIQQGETEASRGRLKVPISQSDKINCDHGKDIMDHKILQTI